MNTSRKIAHIVLTSFFLLPWLLSSAAKAQTIEDGRVIHLIYVNQNFHSDDTCDGLWQFQQGSAANGTYRFTIPQQGNYTVTCTNGVCNPSLIQYACGQNENLSQGKTFEIIVNGYSYTSVFTSAAVQYADHGPSKVVRAPVVNVYVDGIIRAGSNLTDNDAKSGGNQCDKSEAMASYSVHSMLVSLNITDTPLRYSPQLGPAIDFRVTYNQKETQQPAAFPYSNLGPKWTFNWLSYVSDDPDPAKQLPLTSVYVPGGGAEIYSYNATSQTFAPHPQSHATLVKTGASSYERRFPDGSKHIYNLSDGAASYPRRIFMTQSVDPAGNAVTIGYDGAFRITTLTDPLSQITNLAYELPGDPLKITKVTDPFGRYATFQYENGKLEIITDPVGIQSQFTYVPGTDSINALTTPYGTTTFVSGTNGTNRWVEITDPLGGKERVEYRDNAPGINASDPPATVPAGFTSANSGLTVANTFYWNKKAMADAPGNYTKAKVTHWLYNSDGSVSGIASSEKQPLENRVWFAYAGQPHYQYAGPSANPSKIARVLGDGSTQLRQYEYKDSTGKPTKAVDPKGRITTYKYATNDIDLLNVYQQRPGGVSTDPFGAAADNIATYTYNPQDPPHLPHTYTDASGLTTTYTYNTNGQILTSSNSKTAAAYTYGDGSDPYRPQGYLIKIVRGEATTHLLYTAANVRGIRTEPTVAIPGYDGYGIWIAYDKINRPTWITYPDGTHEEFYYTETGFPGSGPMLLDLTGSRDSRGGWQIRHYNGNRQMDSFMDRRGLVTKYHWCACGSLESIEDPRQQVTRFHYDVQGRVHQKVFADNTVINYLYEGQTGPNATGATSRLRSMTEAAGQTTSYDYFPDENVKQVTYTNAAIQTNPVAFTYDDYYDRISKMEDGSGVSLYAYYPVPTTPSTNGAGRLKSVDGPLPSDTIVYTYNDELREVGVSINGVASTMRYDTLGRLTRSTNSLGTFIRTYDPITRRLQTVFHNNGKRSDYGYFDNNGDLRLKTLDNLSSSGANLSTFDYTYGEDFRVATDGVRARDVTDNIYTWTKQLGTLPALTGTYTYDSGDRLTSATTATVGVAPGSYNYDYDFGGNRTLDEVAPGTHSFNSVNQTQDPGYTYDLNGNLTSDGVRSYFWDAANRLVAIESPPRRGFELSGVRPLPTPTPTEPPIGVVVPPVQPTPTPTVLVRSEFSYDGLGRRARIIEKQAGGVDEKGNPVWTALSDRRYIWNGYTVAEERDGANPMMVTKRFYSEGEQINGATYYYTRDHLGSIREMTDATGALRSQYEYDPYGNRTKLSGDVDADFGFTGHYHHTPSGLNLALYRAYSPKLGRWLSRDPIGEMGPDGPNLYGYVRNNPINLVDPLGEWGIGWGDAKGNVSFNLGWGHPTFLFTPQSGMDVSMAAGATLDGIIPFADPYADAGAYDECDPDFQWSRTLGELSRDLYSGATALRLARLVPKGRYNPWLGDVQRHAAHAGGPHQYPHLQIMLRTGASRTSHWRIPLGPGR